MSSKKTGIDQGLIRELAELLKEADLTEIEIEQDDFRIRVTRGLSPSTVNVTAPVPAPNTAPPSSDPRQEAKPESADPSKHPGALPSPMVGTAYLSPEPGAAPFAKEGDTVKAGQTVMIVEAMKTMNPIPAHRSGTVLRVLVEDAQPVEYGEPLMIIE